MKRIYIIISLIICTLLSGCSVQIFETPPVTEAQYKSQSEIKLNKYYVKNGTKFSEVYMPNCSFSGVARYVDQSRLIYMYEDQPMIPDHYKGEIIAYSSASSQSSDITIERFKDMGYSIGIYGGKLEDDGYYHMDSSSDVCPGSNAEEIFSKISSADIRIVSIGNVPIANVIDSGSGVITSLKKDNSYVIEFYAGTFFYRINFIADTNFLKSMELYKYPSTDFKDTKNGYKSFETPEDYKSGYYMVNGSGLFLYHAFSKEEYVESENLNESGFETEAEALAAYSQEFKVSIPYDTKNVVITAPVSNIDSDIKGKVMAPNGTIYDMESDMVAKELGLELSVAKAGEWRVFIPTYYDVKKLNVEGSEMAEETVCKEYTFSYDTESSYQHFEVNIHGSGSVYAFMMQDKDQRIYDFVEGEKKTNTGKQRYLYLDMPYMQPGTYTAYIYYYQSSTDLGEMIVTDYVNSDSDIILIDQGDTEDEECD